ncbi:MAG: SnoaL-like domain-containing protein, partial [Gammaproteobacteria bacterium]|nr:SnoaL-like domain-containing protein [Gammaproteobacteria bacterium]
MSSELESLKKRIDRLEAKEAVLSAFNRYLYCLDTGFGDDLIDCFTDDAVLDVPNFPGAGGDDLHFEGREQISPL